MISLDKQVDDAFLDNNIGGAYLDLQNFPGATKETIFAWYQPGQVGNTNPVPPTPHGTYEWFPGTPATFKFNAVPTNEDNFYRYMRLYNPAFFPKRFCDNRAYLLGNLPAWQALEWQFQFQANGKRYTAAWQLSTTSGVRIWNMAANAWQSVPVTLPDLSKLIQVRCDYSITPDTLTHESIIINGNIYKLGVSQSAVATPITKFTIADQCDPRRGGAGSLIINDISLRYI